VLCCAQAAEEDTNAGGSSDPSTSELIGFLTSLTDMRSSAEARLKALFSLEAVNFSTLEIEEEVFKQLLETARSPQAHMSQRHSAFWASITNSMSRPDDLLHKAIGEGVRAAARAEADRRQGMARDAAMLAYRAQRLPMRSDGHCLFHGLDRLTFVGNVSPEEGAFKMRDMVADFYTAKTSAEAESGSSCEEGSWTHDILMQRESHTGPSDGSRSCSRLDRADCKYVSNYIDEMRTGQTRLSRAELGRRRPGWGGDLELMAWVEMMRTLVFQKVHNACLLNDRRLLMAACCLTFWIIRRYRVLACPATSVASTSFASHHVNILSLTGNGRHHLTVMV
jgi:hypothetical protein